MRGFLVYSNTLFHNMEVKYSFVQTFISHTLKIWALYVIFLFLKSGRADGPGQDGDCELVVS